MAADMRLEFSRPAPFNGRFAASNYGAEKVMQEAAVMSMVNKTFSAYLHQTSLLKGIADRLRLMRRIVGVSDVTYDDGVWELAFCVNCDTNMKAEKKRRNANNAANSLLGLLALQRYACFDHIFVRDEGFSSYMEPLLTKLKNFIARNPGRQIFCGHLCFKIDGIHAVLHHEFVDAEFYLDEIMETANELQRNLMPIVTNVTKDAEWNEPVLCAECDMLHLYLRDEHAEDNICSFCAAEDEYGSDLDYFELYDDEDYHLSSDDNYQYSDYSEDHYSDHDDPYFVEDNGDDYDDDYDDDYEDN